MSCIQNGKPTTEQIDKTVTAAQEWLDMTRWSTVWPRVIAKAWADDGYRKKLENASPNDLRQIMADDFGYCLNPNLDLQIRYDEDDEKRLQTSNQAFWSWEELNNAELTVWIPSRPKPEHGALAITYYAETGRTYPFTSF